MIEPPKPGRYVSQNGRESCFVSDVDLADDEDDDTGVQPFFLVTVIEDDDLLESMELSPVEWQEYVSENALEFKKCCLGVDRSGLCQVPLSANQLRNSRELR
jgi:hypothetical protein